MAAVMTLVQPLTFDEANVARVAVAGMAQHPICPFDLMDGWILLTLPSVCRSHCVGHVPAVKIAAFVHIARPSISGWRFHAACPLIPGQPPVNRREHLAPSSFPLAADGRACKRLLLPVAVLPSPFGRWYKDDRPTHCISTLICSR
jgi:hypothetical protein